MKNKFIAASLAVIMLFAVLIPSGLFGNIKATGNDEFIPPENLPPEPENFAYIPMHGDSVFSLNDEDASQYRDIEWQVCDHETGAMYFIAEGQTVTIKYELVEPMVFADEGHDNTETAWVFVTGIKNGTAETPREIIKGFRLLISSPEYNIQDPIEPEITDPMTVDPPAGYFDNGDGSTAPVSEEPGEGADALNAPPMGAQADPVRLEVEYKYQDENGNVTGIIAPGWYLENPDGTTSYEVTFHEIAGYKATLNGEEQTSYTFIPNENGEYDPKKITVIYVPQDVNYTVNVYQEKLEGGYELKKTETKRAKTGTLVDMTALCNDTDLHIVGFGDPYYKEQPRVAGDGSTVAEIYVDRAFFLMDFDLGEGGYGVEPIYKKYGETISVGTPTRPGYTFKGWKLADETAEIPATMPAEDRTYVADWEMKTPANVTVNIWGEEANTEDYELIFSNTIQAQSGQQLDQNVLNAGLTEVDANLWVYEKTEPNPLPEVNPDGSTVVNVYYKRTLKTLTFNPVGSTMTKWVATNTKAEDWADGGADNDHRPKWDTDYTWEYRSMGATKTVNVQALQTYLNENYPNPEEGQVAEYTYLAEKPGFFDDGKKTMHFVFHDGAWYVGEEQQVPVPADSFYTITAKWGSNIADKWDAACVAGSCHNWSEKTNGNSPWTSGVRVMFDRNINYYKGSDSGSGTCQATYWGEKLDAPGEYELIYTATADGSFGLTVSDEDRLQFEGYTYDHGTENDEYYNGAKFYYTRNTYKVIYVNSPNPNHEKDAKFEQSLNAVPYNNYTPDYPSNLEPGMYTFGGWYVDPTCTVEMDWTDKTMPAKNITVYAKWNPITHNVTFRKNETDQIPETPAATVAHNALIPESAVPTYTKEGFTFVGWFYKIGEEEHAFKPDMPVKRDMDLYAKWKGVGEFSYTVNYYLEGTTTPVAELTVGIGTPGAEFTVNAKKGYSENHPSELYYEYWQFYTPTKETETFTLDEDNKVITFYYKEETATINYVPVTAEQGSVSPTTETIGKVTGEPQGSTPTPVTNYKFVGWYTDEACTQPVPADWVDATTHKLTPKPTFNAGVPTTGTSTLWVFEDKTYYAKFELDIADLTIVKNVDELYSQEVFVFDVTGENDFAMQVCISASDFKASGEGGFTGKVTIKGLKAGHEYTVTEDTSWNWRYSCESGNAAQEVTLTANGTNTVTFTNTLTDDKWLSWETSVDNRWDIDGTGITPYPPGTKPEQTEQ